MACDLIFLKGHCGVYLSVLVTDTDATELAIHGSFAISIRVEQHGLFQVLLVCVLHRLTVKA